MNLYLPLTGVLVHDVNITIQERDFVGHIQARVIGSWRGMDVLHMIDFSAGPPHIVSMDCNLTYEQDTGIYRYILLNREKYKVAGQSTGEELNRKIVALEIIGQFTEGEAKWVNGLTL